MALIFHTSVCTFHFWGLPCLTACSSVWDFDRTVKFLTDGSHIHVFATYAEVLTYTVKFNMPENIILKVMIPNLFLSSLLLAFRVQRLVLFVTFYTLYPATQKVAWFYVIHVHFECPSVRPSPPKCIASGYLVCATPPSVLCRSFLNFPNVSVMDWRCACDLDIILSLLFITYSTFLT